MNSNQDSRLDMAASKITICRTKPLRGSDVDPVDMFR